MTQYIAKVKSSARRSDEVEYLAGQEVYILPESRKWIPAIKDYQFHVLPVNTKNVHLDKDVRLCARHLRPLNKNAAFVLSAEPPAL